jgi:hypothetical protein
LNFKTTTLVVCVLLCKEIFDFVLLMQGWDLASCLVLQVNDAFAYE